MRFAVALTLILAVAVLVVHARPTAAQQPDSAGTYVGTLSGCQNPTFSLGELFWFDVRDRGASITNLHVTSVSVPVGNFPSLDIPTSIPIAADGSFRADFSPLDLTSGPIVVSTHIEGVFDVDNVSGSYIIVVNGTRCDGTFAAVRGNPPTPVPTATPSPVRLTTTLPRDGDCGGGALSITISSDRRSIISLSATDVSGNGATFGGSATFAEGSVRIADNGSFGWVYMPGNQPGQEIAINGMYDGDVRGLLTVSPSMCPPIPFDAREFAVSLPVTGQGGASSADSLAWLVVAAAAGGILSVTGLRRLLRHG